MGDLQGSWGKVRTFMTENDSKGCVYPIYILTSVSRNFHLINGRSKMNGKMNGKKKGYAKRITFNKWTFKN